MKNELRTPAYVHPTAIVDVPVQIGDGTKIWHFSHVSAHTIIGENCSFGQNTFVAPHVRIGANVKVQNNVSIYEGVVLEDDVFCGPSMVFTNVATPRSAFPRRGAEHYAQTTVRRGATIGANATIVCGHEIGEFAFVGAGSVVTKDVPPYAMVYGNPARIRGYACQCGVKLEFVENRATCSSCSRAYHRSGALVSYAEADA
jgi:UDP-2-acetamido-3-amino-2,3-dideoxy-glucuronate N-acetyltransferase